jgi:hypothetical protein
VEEAVPEVENAKEEEDPDGWVEQWVEEVRRQWKLEEDEKEGGSSRRRPECHPEHLTNQVEEPLYVELYVYICGIQAYNVLLYANDFFYYAHLHLTTYGFIFIVKTHI